MKQSEMFCAFTLLVLSAICGTGSSYTKHGFERIVRQVSLEQYAEEDLCQLPGPLANGRFSPSPIKRPTHVSNPACQMVPGTIVPPNYPIFIACNSGFKLNKPNAVSVCIQGKWTPTFPSCVKGTGSRPIYRPECVVSSDCPFNKACSNEKCQDPCTGTCGGGAICIVFNHSPMCSCPGGYTGDPFVSCQPILRTNTTTKE